MQVSYVTLEQLVVSLLEAKGITRPSVTPTESLFGSDLGLDSLDIAELSVKLEQTVGDDPFSQGVFPQTLEELQNYYANLN